MTPHYKITARVVSGMIRSDSDSAHYKPPAVGDTITTHCTESQKPRVGQVVDFVCQPSSYRGGFSQLEAVVLSVEAVPSPVKTMRRGRIPQ